jgi:hypothetical protein
MRPFLLITMLALASFDVEAREGVSERAEAYALAQAQIAKIAGPSRSTVVEIEIAGEAQSRKQRVQVKGPIPEAGVIDLAHLQLVTDKRYLMGPGDWEVEVVGDFKFARLTAKFHCPDCEYLTSCTYSFDQGKWKLLYGERMVQ